MLLAQSRLEPQQATAFRLAALPSDGELTAESMAALLDMPPPQAYRLLESLVDMHLLLTAPNGTYRFHRLVQAFARRQAWEHEGGERCDAALSRLARFRARGPAATAALLTRPIISSGKSRAISFEAWQVHGCRRRKSAFGSPASGRPDSMSLLDVLGDLENPAGPRPAISASPGMLISNVVSFCVRLWRG